MIELILFVLLALTVLILMEWKARRDARIAEEQQAQDQETQPKTDGECCGQHLVCERETLLQTNAEIVYYDDEELDRLSRVPLEEMTDDDQDAIREVFHTLQEKDVPGWCRSMQLRAIELPYDVREEALLIVRERRHM